MGRGDTSAAWLSAIGTLAAVVVALFGPVVRGWLARPRLELVSDLGDLSALGDLIFVDGEDTSTQVRPLFLINRGRSHADEVEAILTVEETVGPIEQDEGEPAIPAFSLASVPRGVMRFELADSAAAHVTVPQGAVRRLEFVFMGSSQSVRNELATRGETLPTGGHEVSGAFCVWPVEHTSRSLWASDDDILNVIVTITARNAKTRSWTAKIRVYRWTLGAELGGVTLAWETPLHRHRAPGYPGPLRRRLALMTPRQRTFRRLMKQTEQADEDEATSA